MRRSRVWLGLVLACGAPAPDLERDRAELLRLHDEARTAHLDKRADLMVAWFDDSLRSVARGGLTIASPEENRTRLNAMQDEGVDYIVEDNGTLKVGVKGEVSDSVARTAAEIVRLEDRSAVAAEIARHHARIEESRTLINRFRQGMIGYTYLDRE